MGFPWLEGLQKKKAELANQLVKFSWDVLASVSQQSKARFCLGLTEHPEHLGRVHAHNVASMPASIWDMSEARTLAAEGWQTRVFHQSPMGAFTAKPTRILYNEGAFDDWGVQGWPSFDSNGKYTGPLAPISNEKGHSIIRKAGDTGPFATAASATYPEEMCKRMAMSIFKAAASSFQEGRFREAAAPATAAGTPGAVAVAPATAAGAPGAVPATATAVASADIPVIPAVLNSEGAVATPEATAVPTSPSAPVPKGITKGEIKEHRHEEEVIKQGWWGLGSPIRIKDGAGRWRGVLFPGSMASGTA